MPAAGQVDGPVVQAHGQVEQPGVGAGEVEIEHAREARRRIGRAVGREHHVVAEHVGMHRAARQRRVGRRFGDMVLVGQLGAQQRRLRLVHVGQHHRGGLVPPGQAAQVGLDARVVAPGQVHAGQHGAQFGAVGGRGGQLAAARQLLHQRRGLAGHAVQQLAGRLRGNRQRMAGRRRHGRVGHGRGHRQAGTGQVLHQAKVVRQLLGAQALEQRQHEFARLGGGEVVGVLDAALDAAQLAQGAHAKALDERVCLAELDFGKNCHGDAQRRTAAAGEKREGGKENDDVTVRTSARSRHAGRCRRCSRRRSCRGGRCRRRWAALRNRACSTWA
ncbi:hypothetical protein D9M72_226390 [compost metagenome]